MRAGHVVSIIALCTVMSCGGDDDDDETDTGGVDGGGGGADAARLDGSAMDAAAVDAAAVDAGGGGTDASGVAFVAIEPCDTSGDYVAGTSVATTAENLYDPPCIRVTSGATVTIAASTVHPLAPGTSGTSPNPIPTTTSPASVTFATPGFYPFFCQVHGTLGMRGVVQVIP